MLDPAGEASKGGLAVGGVELLQTTHGFVNRKKAISNKMMQFLKVIKQERNRT